MKRNLLALSAVVLAVVFSSFTNRVDTTFYYIYDQVNTQKQLTSYTEVTTQPSHVSGTSKLNWLRVIDHNDGVIDQTEFETQFEIYDVVNDSQDKLSDETSDINGQLDIKS